MTMKQWLITVVFSLCLVSTQLAVAEGGVQDNTKGWSVALATGLSSTMYYACR